MTFTTFEQREGTVDDWQTAVARLLERGAQPDLLYEAMIEVAVRGYADMFGKTAADGYLRQLIGELEEGMVVDAAELLEGEPPT